MAPTLLKPGSLVANSKDKQKELDQWIPLEYIMEWFRQRQDKTGLKNRVLVLKSDTGSGKSTAFPPTLYKNFFPEKIPKGTPGIAVTQPKVMNAITIVRDQIVAGGFYPWMKLGENIGWQTGPSKRKPRYGLTYMTLGVLSQQMKTLNDEQIMSRYRYIIIDEVHEASLEQAMLLLSLRNFMFRNQDNPKLPFLVLTSATFDINKFLNYFNVFNSPEQPNLIQVAGFTYELIEKWDYMTVSTADYINTTVNTIKMIHKENPADTADNADILVFLPGGAEMTQVKDGLDKLLEKLAKKGSAIFMVLQIDSDAVKQNKPDFANLTADIGKLRVFIDGKPYKPHRRVILSTSVAETGVTIDTLKYVVDSGFHRGPEFNPHLDVAGVITKVAQQSRIRQRKGRANRKSYGVFYPLYPKYVYDSLPKEQLADIEVSDIGPIILGIILEHLKAGANDFNYRQLLMVDPPPSDTMHLYLQKLYAMGFLSPSSYYQWKESKEDNLVDLLEIIRDSRGQSPRFSLTRLGAIASNFSYLMPEQIRIILASYFWKASTLDLITIASYMAMKAKAFSLGTQQIKWTEIYMKGLPKHYLEKAGFGSGYVAPAIAYYRARILIADDFIDGLILFEAISKVTEEVQTTEFISKLEDWCESVNVSYEAIVDFISLRDDIIEQALSFGLNITLGEPLMNSPAESFLDSIVRLKYCIYDGYRCNLLRLDDANGNYKTSFGVPIKTPPMFSQNEQKKADQEKYGITPKTKPKYILAEGLEFKLERETNIYSIRTNRVSVLDGFVKIDLHFLY